jgi:hypothetical protein
LAFCLLNPQAFILLVDSFEMIEGLIFFLQALLNLEKMELAAATLICWPIILLQREKKTSLRVVK